MGRATKKEKECPECGRPRKRLYQRHYVSGRSYNYPFAWFCSSSKHGFIIWIDDPKIVLRRHD